MRDTLYRERQLWSGNESVEIRYVSGSSVAGTSASSPGVPRHIRNEENIIIHHPAILLIAVIGLDLVNRIVHLASNNISVMDVYSAPTGGK